MELSEADAPIIHGNGEDIATVNDGRVKELFAKHGACFFRGFATTPEGFRRFTDRFSKEFLTYPDPTRKMIDATARIQSVSIGEHEIPIHSELSYTPLAPPVGWLYCQEFDCRGGQTVICDGARVADGLPAHLRALFEKRTFRYRSKIPNDLVEFMFGVSSTADVESEIRRRGLEQHYKLVDGRVVQNYQTPCLVKRPRTGRYVFANNVVHNSRVPTWLRLWELAGLPKIPGVQRRKGVGAGIPSFPQWGSGLPISRSVVRELIKVTAPLEREISWRPGDVLMWDNKQWMHGRREWSGHREILTRWGTDFLGDRS